MNRDRAASITMGSGLRKPRWFRGRQSGQSLVELGLLIPFFVLLLLGVIEIGRYAYIAILVGNAARAGAAYGAQSSATVGDTAGITTAAKNDFLTNGQSTLNVTSSYTCGCDSAGAVTTYTCSNGPSSCSGSQHWVVTLNVTASGSYSPLFNYPGIPKPLALSNTAKVRISQ